MSVQARLQRRVAAEQRRLLEAGVRHPTIARRVAIAAVRRRARHDGSSLPLEHGTHRGYQQHRVDGDPPCRRCLYAHSDYRHDRAQASKTGT